MSSQRSSAASKTTHQHEINDLIFNLQALLPQLNQSHASRVSASKVLEETCRYIRKLQREADDLSEKISQQLDSLDISTADLEFLRNYIQL